MAQGYLESIEREYPQLKRLKGIPNGSHFFISLSPFSFLPQFRAGVLEICIFHHASAGTVVVLLWAWWWSASGLVSVKGKSYICPALKASWVETTSTLTQTSNFLGRRVGHRNKCSIT
jgi:hypothetical protein